jgi:hypothetical protein
MIDVGVAVLIDRTRELIGPSPEEMRDALKHAFLTMLQMRREQQRGR